MDPSGIAQIALELCDLLQLQLDSIMGRKLTDFTPEEKTPIRRGNPESQNCVPNYTGSPTQHSGPYSVIEVGLTLPRREVGRGASPAAAFFSHSPRSRFISAIIASSFLGSLSPGARSCSSRQPSGSPGRSGHLNSPNFDPGIAPTPLIRPLSHNNTGRDCSGESKCPTYFASIASGSTITNFPIDPLSMNLMRPVILANSVSSLPRPTFSPGFTRVPRWRTMIVPPGTSCPPKALNPSRCALESRPFREVPCPFLCAINQFPVSSGQLPVKNTVS